MPRYQVYDPMAARQLEGVPLPAKIKCDRCDKYKVQAAFSNKQLTDARYLVKHHGQSASYKIKCHQCTGIQPVELECSVCGITKGLEEFAKSQRKQDDKECYKCTEKRLDVVPINQSKYEDENSKRVLKPSDDFVSTSVFDHSSDSDTSSEWTESRQEGGVGLSDGFARSMSLSTTSQAHSLIETEFERGNQIQPQGYRTIAQQSWHTPSSFSQSQTTSISSDTAPSGYRNPDSISGSQHTFDSAVAERSDNGKISMSANGNFAKIKAYIPPKTEEWSSDEESDNDSEASDDAEEDSEDDGEL